MSKYYKVDEVESLLSCGCAYAIRELPIVEASEDAISREWILEEFQKGREKIDKSEYFLELMWLVKHAPSVVPKEKVDKSLKKQLKDIKTVGTIATEEEYGLFGCRFRTVKRAPSIIPKTKEGEWIE